MAMARIGIDVSGRVGVAERIFAGRWWLLPVFLLLLIQALMLFGRVSGSYQFNRFNRDDTDSYMALADALAAGRGYTRSSDPRVYVPHTHFPPGMPVLIVLGQIFGYPVAGPQVMVMITALLVTVFAWLLARCYLPAPQALLVLVLVVFNPVQDRLSSVVMSELPLLMLILLVLWSAERWLRSGCRLHGWGLLWAFGLGLGMMVKGMIAPLWPAIVLAGIRQCVCKRQLSPDAGGCGRSGWPVSVFGVLALLPFGLWVLRNVMTPAFGFDGTSHLHETLTGDMHGQTAFSIWRLSGFVLQNFKWHLGTRLIDGFGAIGWLCEDTGVLIWPGWLRMLVIIGFVYCLVAVVRRYDMLLPAVTLCFAVMLLLIRYNGGTVRFWTAWWPVVAMVWVGGISASLEWFVRSARWRYCIGGALAGLAVLVVVFGWSVDFSRRLPQDGAVWQSFVQACQAAGRQTEDQVYLLSHNAPAARLISGRGRLPVDPKIMLPEHQDQVIRFPAVAIIPKPEAVALHRRRTPIPAGVELEVFWSNRYYQLAHLKPALSSRPTTGRAGDLGE